MSKLIVNTGTLSSGGAERVLSILSYPFVESFDEVYYVLWLDAKYPEIYYDISPRVKIIRISRECGSTRIWKQMLWFRRFVKKESPDIVLSFMVMVCLTVSASLIFSGINQVVAERNDPRYHGNRLTRIIIDSIYLSHDIKCIIMQTQWNKNYFKNNVLKNKTNVIFNPIILDSSLVGAAIMSEKDDIIVSVGRLTAQKQQNVLLDAFSQFHPYFPSFKLIIYGEGEERLSLMQRAKDLGIEDFFELPGRTKDVFRKLMKAKMFVMTSEYEGMSNALAEAMCLGLPCISTKVSGATDLIQDGINGFIVDVGDVCSITSKMKELASNLELNLKISKSASNVYSLLNGGVLCQKWVNTLKKYSR